MKYNFLSRMRNAALSQKIQQLKAQPFLHWPREWQRAIFFLGSFLCYLCGLLWFDLYSGKIEENKKYLEQLLHTIQTQQKVIQQAVLLKKSPIHTLGISRFMHAFSECTKKNQVEVLSIKRIPLRENKDVKIQAFQVHAKGRYENILACMQKISSMPDMSIVEAFDITSSTPEMLDIQMQIEIHGNTRK